MAHQSRPAPVKDPRYNPEGTSGAFRIQVRDGRHRPPGHKGWAWGIAAFVLLILGITAYFVVPLVGSSIKQDALRKNGTLAKAKILSVRETNTRINEHWVFEVELEVHPEGAAPYKTKVAQPFSMLHAPNLRSGAGAEVRYDPKNPAQIVVISTGGPPPDPARSPTQEQPSTPDPLCNETADCCLIVLGETGRTACEGFLNPTMSPQSCRAALDGYRLAASNKGRACPQP